MSKLVYTLYTRHVTDVLEGRDTTVDPLILQARVGGLDFHGRRIESLEVGDDVIIRSDDGDDFIGFIKAVEDSVYLATVMVVLD